MKKILYILLFGMFVLSCNENNDGAKGVDADIQVKEGAPSSKLTANSKSASELKKDALDRKEKREREEKERLDKQTTMEITPNVYNFGEIKKETPVSTVFTVKNTGDKPLIINDAKASCGCTVPRKPEDPVLPGEEGELEVTFTSNAGQAGSSINKTVTVTANIPGSTKVVTIKGNVEQ